MISDEEIRTLLHRHVDRLAADVPGAGILIIANVDGRSQCIGNIRGDRFAVAKILRTIADQLDQPDDKTTKTGTHGTD